MGRGGGGWGRQKGMGVSSQCYCSFLSLTTLRSPVFTNEYRLFATTDYKPYLLLKASGSFLMIIRSGTRIIQKQHLFLQVKKKKVKHQSKCSPMRIS